LIDKKVMNGTLEDIYYVPQDYPVVKQEILLRRLLQ